jgi:hypothetical protein
MTENNPGEAGRLPVISDKELLAMNQLMAESAYQIKLPFSFLRPDRTDKINPDFVLYTLNDHLGHIQRCFAATVKMLPSADHEGFFRSLSAKDPVAASLMKIVCDIDIKSLSSQLGVLQNNARNMTVDQLVPFIRILYRSILRAYYLGSPGISRLYKAVFFHVSEGRSPADAANLKVLTTGAIDEWYYIFNHLFPGLYPLLLRMCSPRVLSLSELFYAHGSMVLSWLSLVPSDILILRERDTQPKPVPVPVVLPPEPVRTEEVGPVLSDDVKKGLALLERLFPEAGWDRLDEMPDMCPYFQPILHFSDAFIQLSPDNPLHVTMILFWILEELFQGLRLIKFNSLESTSATDDVEDIDAILEEWILYQESIFDKTFSDDLKAYTHQIYTQPDYYKTPYGRKLLSNLYTLTKHMFLPWFDIRMYGSAKATKDDRLPPFFIRVSRLRHLLVRYYREIREAPAGSDADPSGVLSGIRNPWEIYKFDIANPVSRRLDAICGGKHSRTRTNALLIEYTSSVLSVLDWWINSKDSYGYKVAPEYLYRVIEPGSAIPAFGVTARTDIETLFIQHLRSSSFGGTGHSLP